MRTLFPDKPLRYYQIIRRRWKLKPRHAYMQTCGIYCETEQELLNRYKRLNRFLRHQTLEKIIRVCAMCYEGDIYGNNLEGGPLRECPVCNDAREALEVLLDDENARIVRARGM